MAGVFISYRRDDSAEPARRIFDALAARLGTDRVFIDAVTLEPGQDFAAAIQEKIGFCDAVVAVIGPRWLTCTGPDGRRRLDQPDDWVRLEIASALSQDVKVIPALVDGADLPDARQLPPALKDLTHHQAIDLRRDQFARDLERLEQALAPSAGAQNPVALWLALLTRRHRALDPLDLSRPAMLWRAFAFMGLMMLVAEALRLPVNARAGLPYWNVAYLAGDVIANCVEWLLVGVALHLGMRFFGGRASLPTSLAVFCFMSAWVPLIALSQVPVWGIRVSIVQDMADAAWNPEVAVEKMQRFVDALGAFGAARLVVSLGLATALWFLLFGSVYRALRSLNRLTGGRAFAGFVLGLVAGSMSVALISAPLLGAVYAAFGIPGR
jgi:TIR domain-containing protein